VEYAINQVCLNLTKRWSKVNDLEMIQRFFYRFRIDFYSIFYWGAKEFTQMPDPNIVRLQQKMLFEKNKWLEDNEAEALLKILPKDNGQP
jgi:hypothetical protein